MCVCLWKVNRLYNYSMNVYNHRLDMSAGLPILTSGKKEERSCCFTHEKHRVVPETVKKK